MLHISSHTFNGCNAYRDSLSTYAVQTAQHAAIVHHVEGTYHLAGCSCPAWTREARSCSAPGSRLPSTFHCQRESGLYNDGAPTYTHTAVYLPYVPTYLTVQLLRPPSPTHPSRRHRDIPIGLTTSTGGSPSAANIRTNPQLPLKCLLTSGGHRVYLTQTARDSSALVVRREMRAPEAIADTSPSAIPRDRAESRRQQEGRYRSRPRLGKNIQIENIAIAQTQP